MNYRKGDIVNLKIEKAILGKEGLARLDGIVFFVAGTIPGEEIEAKITKLKRNFIVAEKIKTLKKSPLEITPKCPWFDNCGGCKYQTLKYEDQLKWKEEHVRESLERIGGFKGIQIEPIIGSPKEWHYRNKIELTAGLNKDGDMEIGFHQQGNFREIIGIDACYIFDERLPKILEIIRTYIQKHQYYYYDMRDNPDGFLQYIIFRKSEYSGALMINFITREGLMKEQQDLINSLLQVVDKLSLLQTINKGGTGYNNHDDKEVVVLFGDEILEEKLGDLKFKISPFSFFQTNTLGAEKLYNIILDFADVNEGEKVLDLYCGTGTIGQYLASKAKEVHGIELVPEAIDQAKENARMNKLNNCTYEVGDARKILKFERDKYIGTNIVVTDPPRSGMAPKALQRMLEIDAKKLIYVSCNPSMLARDLKIIVDYGYKIEKIQPVDMFPHTWHVETVVKLSRG